MESEENKWGIKSRVVTEWGKTFDKLLTYHNKQDWREDLRVMVKSISGNRSSNSTNPEEISVEELTNWMKPRLEPSLWKKYIWPKQYEKEGAQYNAQYEALLGTDQEDKENKRGISKEQFIDGVTREIRDGNQEVNHYDECWIISYKLTLVIVLIDNYS